MRSIFILCFIKKEMMDSGGMLQGVKSQTNMDFQNADPQLERQQGLLHMTQSVAATHWD